VPSSRPANPLKLIGFLVLLAAVMAAAGLVFSRRSDDHDWEAIAAYTPGNTRVAFARSRLCDAGICQTLWVGPTRERASIVNTISGETARVDEIAWTPDGARVGFLVDGYQLRMYDGNTLAPAGQFSLITPDGYPTSRIARGVTFSENGRAVTFDDCPRRQSGCRPGLVAVPQ
jgi:hypothetical protein